MNLNLRSSFRLVRNGYSVVRSTVCNSCKLPHRFMQTAASLAQASKNGGPVLDFPDMGPPIPEYKQRTDEIMEQKRARLFYQSRKRGMSENGLLLSTFATLYLHKLNDALIEQYDSLINKPTNDWEIFYWMTEKKPTPEEYDNEIMDMLKKHVRNEEMEMRHKQPDLDQNTTPTSTENKD